MLFGAVIYLVFWNDKESPLGLFFVGLRFFVSCYLLKSDIPGPNNHYSDFDYENLCELYYKHSWLRTETNSRGFEDLWFDYKLKGEKIIIKRLIQNFKYLTLEEVEPICKEKLKNCIENWELTPDNTYFIGFRTHKTPDGSSIVLNFFKPVLLSIDDTWKDCNLYPDVFIGKRRMNDEGIKNLILVDDFIGTGGTAFNRINEFRNEIDRLDLSLKLYVFSIGMMKEGAKLIRKSKTDYQCCYILDKGSILAFPKLIAELARKAIKRMEGILHEGSEKLKLTDHSLGYGKSETLYSFSRFNLPNNNYPIFWWNKYRNGDKRKSMFNRMQ